MKKNKLLMGLTELLVSEINAASSEKKERAGGFNAPKQKAKTTKNIGFIFFNSNVILEPNNSQ